MDTQDLPWQSFWQSLISHSCCFQERSRLLFPPSPFATVVEVHSQNCDTSSQQLLKCTRTSRTSANAANFFSQDLEFDFWTCVVFFLHHFLHRQCWGGNPGNNFGCGVLCGICICAEHCRLRECSSAQHRHRLLQRLGINRQ